MKKVHISFLHNLDNKEFRIFYSKLLKLILDQEFADPTLTELQSRLQGHKKDVSNLKSRVQKYNNTPKINELTRLRTDYLISFRLEIKAKMLSYDANMRVAADRLYKWLKNYKKKPFIQSIITQDVVVDSMLNCIKEDKSLQADIALLSLDKLLDAIEKTTLKIGLNEKYRDHEKMSRHKKGRDVRDAAYQEIKTLVDYIASKLNLMQGNVEESEHYKLLLEIHSRLKGIRKDFRIRTAKDKTRRRRKAAKDAALTQLNAAKQAQEKQAHSLDRNPQGKLSKRQITETLEHPSTNKSLTQKAIEAPVKTIPKQKKEISKPKMSRRKIMKLLI